MTKETKIYSNLGNKLDALTYYEKGLGYDQADYDEKNRKKALSCYRKAAKLGCAAAQCKLGEAYDWGDGVKKDKSKAAKYFRMAAEQGHTSAQFLLGVCYDSGEGIKQDKTKAKECYLQAAEQGNDCAIDALNDLLFEEEMNKKMR